MLRLLVVFVHVCAAMGVFGAAAIEGASLLQLNRPGGTSITLQGLGLSRRLGSLSFALVLLSGIFLTQTVWGWEAGWIRVSMMSLIVMVAIGATVGRRAVGRLRAALDTAGAYDVLIRSFLLRAGLLLGIVFLMTVKPPLTESLIVMAAAAGAGFLVGLPSGRRREIRAA